MPRIILTGASGALGSATADRLREDGHVLACIARSVPSEVSEADHWIACDLTNVEAARDAVSAAVAALDGLDGVVHVAGGFGYKRIEQDILEDWRRLQQANVETALNVIGAALPLLSDGGSIVTVGAAAAQTAAAGMGPYAAAKSGVARLTEALAAELATRGIRVNSVLPQIIDTPDNRAAMPEADFSSWTSPAAIAEVIAFLVRPEARAINGAHIPVTNPG